MFLEKDVQNISWLLEREPVRIDSVFRSRGEVRYFLDFINDEQYGLSLSYSGTLVD